MPALPGEQGKPVETPRVHRRSLPNGRNVPVPLQRLPVPLPQAAGARPSEGTQQGGGCMIYLKVRWEGWVRWGVPLNVKSESSPR